MVLKLEQSPIGKRCVRCGQWKSLSDFNYNHVNGVQGRQSYCRRCQHEYAAQNYLSRERGGAVRETRASKPEEYDILYAMYKEYRTRLDTFVNEYGNGEDVEERLAFEYEIGL